MKRRPACAGRFCFSVGHAEAVWPIPRKRVARRMGMECGIRRTFLDHDRCLPAWATRNGFVRCGESREAAKVGRTSGEKTVRAKRPDRTTGDSDVQYGRAGSRPNGQASRAYRAGTGVEARVGSSVTPVPVPAAVSGRLLPSGFGCHGTCYAPVCRCSSSRRACLRSSPPA